MAGACLIALSSSAAAQEPSVRSGDQCDASPGTAVLEGVVRDLLTGNPMPGASVILRSREFASMQLGEGSTDLTGAYRFCDVPQIPGLTVQAVVEGIQSRLIGLPDPPRGEVEPLYIEWSTPVDLVGRVVDAQTNAPLAGARVAVVGRGAQSTTNDDGVFRVQGQGAGRMVLESSMLGYAPRTDTLDTASGDVLDVTIRMSVEAIELDPIEVSVQRLPEAQARAEGSRFDVMTPAEVDAVLPRVIDFGGLVRNALFPGIRVSTLADGTLCIANMRNGPDCAMVEVYLDGIRLSHAETVLVSLDPNVVESIQYLDAFEARIRFMGPRVHNGVLLIRTRSGRRPGSGPGGPR